MKKRFIKMTDLKKFKPFSDSAETQLFVARFENISWKILMYLSDKINQTRVAMILALILSSLYLLDSSNLSSLNLLIRMSLMILSILLALVALKTNLVHRSMGFETLSKVASSMRTVSTIVVLSSLIFAPEIYSSIFAKSIEIACLVFLLASFINKSSDMYEN